MARVLLSCLLALMLAVLSVAAPAHAADMARMVAETSHDMAIEDVSGAAMDCCRHEDAAKSHDLLCEFACAAAPILPDRTGAAFKSVRLFALFPTLNPVMAPGRSPTLPERPPKHGFPSA